jgi:hypothetical protein
MAEVAGINVILRNVWGKVKYRCKNLTFTLTLAIMTASANSQQNSQLLTVNSQCSMVGG